MLNTLAKFFMSLFVGGGRSPVVELALDVLNGNFTTDTTPGYCLRVVREIVEAAFDVPERALYNRVIVPQWRRLEKGSTPFYWASSAEVALRSLGLHTNDPEPGDLLFSSSASRPYGHVGILLDGDLVLENTMANRGWRKPGMGAVRLTPLSEFDEVTTAISWRRLRDVLVK